MGVPSLSQVRPAGGTGCCHRCVFLEAEMRLVVLGCASENETGLPRFTGGERENKRTGKKCPFPQTSFKIVDMSGRHLYNHLGVPTAISLLFGPSVANDSEDLSREQQGLPHPPQATLAGICTVPTCSGCTHRFLSSATNPWLLQRVHLPGAF